MKKNHTKILLLLCLFWLNLEATTYEWKAYVNKEKAYVNEAIYFSYRCEFSDRAELYAVEFNPVRNDENATIVMLSERSKIEDGKKILLYEFVAFSHRPDAIVFAFEALMKKTTKESIENTVIGRDNRKYAEYQTTLFKQKELTVEIFDTQTPLVGSLKMEIKKNKPEVKSLTPYHLEIKLSGVANFDALEAFSFTMDGVRVFSEKPIQNLELTKDGYKGVWSQKFAFVGENDFKIAPFSIVYFDLVSKEKKELRFDGADVGVLEGYKREELLDEEPESKYALKIEYLYYLLTFVAGFLAAKIEFKRKRAQKESGFCAKIKNASSLDTLCVLLVMQDAQKYESIILQIQNKELASLQKSKKLICG